LVDEQQKKTGGQVTLKQLLPQKQLVDQFGFTP